MDKEKKEIRSGIGGKWKPVLREAAEGGSESRTIEGYAIVFGVKVGFFRTIGTTTGKSLNRVPLLKND